MQLTFLCITVTTAAAQIIQESVDIARILDSSDTHYSSSVVRIFPRLEQFLASREHHASINKDSSLLWLCLRGGGGLFFLRFYVCRVCRVSSVFCVSKSVMYSHGHYGLHQHHRAWAVGLVLL